MMDFNEYQQSAKQTDRTGAGERAHTIAHFGLIGEVGSLLTVFKKRLRDQSAYSSFKEDLIGECGDVLWYLSNICTRYGIPLNDVAETNLNKVQALWGKYDETSPGDHLLDAAYPEHEQLPRRFDIQFCEQYSSNNQKIVRVLIDGEGVGDPLTDNAYEDDGYRYHDIFHVSYAVYLGWSPLLRKVLGRKRKSEPRVDEVEDGARARIAEEAVSLYVYGYAYDHSFFDGITAIDTQLFRAIHALVDGLEVEGAPNYQWKEAILEGYRIFRELRARGGGTVRADLLAPSLELMD